MEWLIPLDTRDRMPLYEQIYRYIKEEIRNGNLPPRKRLPSSRELARSLKVSRSTTQLAYEQLVSEGYLEAVPRKGYFIAGLDGILPPVEIREGREGKLFSASFARSGRGAEKEGASSETARQEGGKGVKRKWRVDFSPRGIDLDSFPFSTWRKISRAVLREEEKEIFLKGDPQGDLPLREAIGAYLHAARGVNCQPSQILVGAGNEYLLMLLSGLLGREAGIAMENPTYLQAWRVFSDLGHQVFPVEMDESGLEIGRLRNLKEKVQAVYVMPSHQFPTGIVMPVKRRQELLAWAKEGEDRFLIEDDYDSEFRYKGRPIPALQGLDSSGKVVYMGTFSKAIAPAIRAAYMVLPPVLAERYRNRMNFYSSTVSRVDQRILTQFIDGGYFERHLNRMREIYKGKHDLLLAALKPLERQFLIEGEYAGLHVLLTDRSGRPEEELIAAAAREGVLVYGLSGFYIGEKREKEEGQERQAKGRSHTVVLGYAKLGDTEIQEGAKALLRAYGSRRQE